MPLSSSTAQEAGLPVRRQRDHSTAPQDPAGAHPRAGARASGSGRAHHAVREAFGTLRRGCGERPCAQSLTTFPRPHPCPRPPARPLAPRPPSPALLPQPGYRHADDRIGRSVRHVLDVWADRQLFPEVFLVDLRKRLGMRPRPLPSRSSSPLRNPARSSSPSPTAARSSSRARPRVLALALPLTRTVGDGSGPLYPTGSAGASAERPGHRSSTGSASASASAPAPAPAAPVRDQVCEHG